MFKKCLKANRTIDYYCLQEKVCIVCSKKTHKIDFDEEFAKNHPNSYTYHGDSEWEKSDFMKF